MIWPRIFTAFISVQNMHVQELLSENRWKWGRWGCLPEQRCLQYSVKYSWLNMVGQILYGRFWVTNDNRMKSQCYAGHVNSLLNC